MIYLRKAFKNYSFKRCY